MIHGDHLTRIEGLYMYDCVEVGMYCRLRASTTSRSAFNTRSVPQVVQMLHSRSVLAAFGIELQGIVGNKKAPFAEGASVFLRHTAHFKWR